MNTASPDLIHVMLGYRPLGLVRATPRALHRDGMSVDTGAVTLPRHSQVEVTLSYRKNNRLQVRKLRASVGGRSDTGTDLTFDGGVVETALALKDLLPLHEQTA